MTIGNYVLVLCAQLALHAPYQRDKCQLVAALTPNVQSGVVLALHRQLGIVPGMS